MIAIDPGNEHSALIEYHDDVVYGMAIEDNETLASRLTEYYHYDHLAIEMVASYGMSVGWHVFETCVWIGRFIECFPGSHTKVYRKDVKMHLCGNVKARDSHIRQALMDRFGSTREKAVGTKAAPGPLYGIRTHLWSALAVAVTWEDQWRAAA